MPKRTVSERQFVAKPSDKSSSEQMLEKLTDSSQAQSPVAQSSSSAPISIDASKAEEYSVIQAALNKWNDVDLDLLIGEVESKQDRDAVLSLVGKDDDIALKGGILRLFCNQKRKSEPLKRLLTWMGEDRCEAMILAQNKFHRNALYYACRNGDSARVAALLAVLPKARHAEAILAQTKGRWNALQVALRHGDDEMVAIVLSALPADKQAEAILAQTKDEWNALHIAYFNRDIKMKSSVLSALPAGKQAEAILAQTKDGANVLLVACRHGDSADVASVVSALPAGKQAEAILAQPKDGWNALHVACAFGDSAMVAALLEQLTEADRAKAILAKSESGSNAVQCACFSGDSTKVASLLSALPADKQAEAILAQSKDGWNALHDACRYGDRMTVATLLESLGSQAYPVFLSMLENDNSDASKKDLLELVSMNTHPAVPPTVMSHELSVLANRKQILDCLETKFPEFFKIFAGYSEQSIFNLAKAHDNIDMAAVIKQTKAQLARAASTAIPIPSSLFERDQSQPPSKATSSTASTSTVAPMPRQ